MYSGGSRTPAGGCDSQGEVCTAEDHGRRRMEVILTLAVLFFSGVVQAWSVDSLSFSLWQILGWVMMPAVLPPSLNNHQTRTVRALAQIWKRLCSLSCVHTGITYHDLKSFLVDSSITPVFSLYTHLHFNLVAKPWLRPLPVLPPFAALKLQTRLLRHPRALGLAKWGTAD